MASISDIALGIAAPQVLVSFTLGKEAVAEIIGKFDPQVADMIKSMDSGDFVSLLSRIGLDLSRAIQGGPGRGQATWEWFEPTTRDVWKWPDWKRMAFRTALLYLFGDKSAPEALQLTMTEKARYDAQQNKITGDTGTGSAPSSSSGGGGMIAAIGLGALALLASGTLHGVRNPGKRRKRVRLLA